MSTISNQKDFGIHVSELRFPVTSDGMGCITQFGIHLATDPVYMSELSI